MEELLAMIEEQPNNIDARMQLVKMHLETQDLDEAQVLLKEVIELDKYNLDANYVLAQIYEIQEDYIQAIEHLKTVVQQQPVEGIVMKLAELYETTDDLENARRLYHDCFTSNPDNMEAVECLANLYFIMGQKQEALQFYKLILAQDPNNMVAHSQLMDIYESSDKFNYYMTRAKINRMNEKVSYALNDYKKALPHAESDADFIETQFYIAELYMQQEKYMHAIDAYLAITDRDEENVDASRSLAESYLKSDNIDSACEAYEKTLELDPTDQESMEELIDLYMDLENYNKAYKWVKKLFISEPENLSYKVTMGSIKLALGDKKDAYTLIQEVLEEDEKNTEALSAMADYFSQEEVYDKALEYVNKIKEVIPASPFGYKKAAEINEVIGNAYETHYNYGVYHHLKKESQLAIDEFTCALEYKSDNSDLAVRIAELYENISEDYVAIEYYQKAISLNNKDVNSYKKLAQLYKKLGDYDSLIQCYTSLLEVDPGNRDACFSLAESYESQKKYDLAIEHYRSCSKMSAPSSWLEEVELKLQKLENETYVKEEQGLIEKFLNAFKF